MAKEIWDVFDELWDFMVGNRPLSGSEKPPMNLYETEEEYVIQIALPGAKKDDIRVEFHEGVLTISGVRREECDDEIRQYHVLEIGFGPFERKVYLGEDIDLSHVSSTLKDGLLEIRIPKRKKQVFEVPIEEEEER